jgi:DNA modification methylase
MAVNFSRVKIPRETINLKETYPNILKKNYLTHGFDKYPAKMIPHMASFLINKTSKPKQSILDPFCGSGSVVIQSVLERRKGIGIDLNPYAILLSKAKITPLDVNQLQHQLQYLSVAFRNCLNPHDYNFYNADYWFTPMTLRKLGIIKKVLENCNLDDDYLNFWTALFVSIVRDCSKADIRGPKPFISKRSKQNRKGKHFNPFKIFYDQAQIWIECERNYLKKLNGRQKKDINYKIIQGDSRRLSMLIKNENIDSIITSPPYLNAQDYYRSSKLQLFFLDEFDENDMRKFSRDIIGSDRLLQSQIPKNQTLPYPLSEKFHSDLNKINNKNSITFLKYIQDMAEVIKECSKILESGSFFSIVIADNKISNIDIPTHELLNEISECEGFHLISIYSDKIRDRRLPVIRNGHEGIMKNENLMIFKKS